jgi:hypothetical protein
VGDLYGIEYPQGGYDAVQLHYGMKEVEDGERYDSRYESTLDLGEVRIIKFVNYWM